MKVQGQGQLAEKCSLKAEKLFYLVKQMIASLVIQLSYETCTHSKCSSVEEGKKTSIHTLEVMFPVPFVCQQDYGKIAGLIFMIDY